MRKRKKRKAADRARRVQRREPAKAQGPGAGRTRIAGEAELDPALLGPIRTAMRHSDERVLAGEVSSRHLLPVWDAVLAATTRTPGLTLHRLERALGGSLTLTVSELREWLPIDARQDPTLLARWRAFCEAYLERFAGEDPDETRHMRCSLAEAIHWTSSRDEAEAYLAEWLDEDPGVGEAWLTWSRLYFDPLCVALPDDDPERALELLREGVARNADPEALDRLLVQLGNVLSSLGRIEESRRVRDRALRAFEARCGHPDADSTHPRLLL